MTQLSFALAISFYLLGLGLSLLNLITKKELFFRFAFAALAIGFVCHTLFLVLLTLEGRHLPIYTSKEAFSLFAWLVTLSFFISYLKYRIQILGIFVLSLVAAFMLIASALERHPFPPDWRGYWVFFHTTLVLIAYVAFFLTFLSSILYLAQERALKEKRMAWVGERLPSLQKLDRLLLTSLIVGMVAMTLGILTGAIWAEHVWGRYWGWDPKETAALVTWLIYLSLFHYRLTAGWRGKRAAILNVIGFISVLFTFLGASYFRGMHAF
ncbi:MAG TPA: cytochrome c biogenesis protein CcsA [Acidobacteriota bacterium]|jgi:cytochrome c-type biogenesis protein CcsB|nr:cytochrome c biogenesis protein CcsA [Acidobacteriota bacterium]